MREAEGGEERLRERLEPTEERSARGPDPPQSKAGYDRDEQDRQHLPLREGREELRDDVQQHVDRIEMLGTFGVARSLRGIDRMGIDVHAGAGLEQF